jgi:hypothetical protein
VIKKPGVVADGAHSREKIVASIGDQTPGQFEDAGAMRAMRLLQQYIIDGDFPKLVDDNGKA